MQASFFVGLVIVAVHKFFVLGEGKYHFKHENQPEGMHKHQDDGEHEQDHVLPVDEVPFLLRRWDIAVDA